MSLLAFVLAATPYLVKDINLKTAPVSSNAVFLATIGSTTYFAADDGMHGKELWKTDGTEAGTVMVKDIAPGGASGADVNEAAVAGNLLVFVGTDDGGPPQLWSSDGTAAGTKRLTDRRGSFARPIGTAGGIVYFLYISTTQYHVELWRTDGTADGTGMVDDLGQDSLIALGTIGQSMVLYRKTPERAGVFITDESGHGMRFVVSSAPPHWEFYNGISLDDALIYSAQETGDTYGIYRTDGSPEGTRLLRSGFGPRSDYIGEPKVRAGKLVFFMATDGTGQRSLWRTDGTDVGTFALTAPLAKYMSLTVLGSSVFFFADTTSYEAGPKQLWKSDGTAAGTGRVDDQIYYNPWSFAAGNVCFFMGWAQDAGGSDLYRNDGTGTRLVRRMSYPWGIGFSSLARGNSIIFTGWNAVNGSEPWISDGTEAGTRLVKNVREDTSRSSSPIGLAERDGTLMFTAFDGDANALWSTDGTAAGTVRVSSDGGTDGTLSISTGKLYYFTRNTTSSSSDLWRSDGTAAGTFSLGRVYGAPVLFRDGVVFFGTDGVLWFSDGTSAGTRAITNPSIREAPLIGSGAAPVVSRGAVYFATGSALWTWDGVAPAPRKVIDLPAIRGLADVDGTLFIAASASYRIILYRSDGTAEGTVEIKETALSDRPLRMFHVGGKLVLWSLAGLWASDGTGQGTIPLRTFSISASCARHDGDFAVVGGVLYWFIADGASELWRSDGTPEGTFVLAHQPSLYPDPDLDPCAAHSIAVANGLIYFTGKDSRNGIEPWVTDGTPSGTHLLFDINPGTASSSAGGFLRVGQTLYFTADDGFHGTELWALPLGDARRRRVTR